MTTLDAFTTPPAVLPASADSSSRSGRAGGASTYLSEPGAVPVHVGSYPRRSLGRRRDVLPTRSEPVVARPTARTTTTRAAVRPTRA